MKEEQFRVENIWRETHEKILKSCSLEQCVDCRKNMNQTTVRPFIACMLCWCVEALCLSITFEPIFKGLTVAVSNERVFVCVCVCLRLQSISESSVVLRRS